MSDYDYCKLYLRSDRSFEEVRNVISNILQAPIEGRTIESRNLIIDCFINKASRDDGPGFLYWPYYLEIEASEGSGGHGFIQELQGLIDNIKTYSMSVVASCDFEDDLTV